MVHFIFSQRRRSKGKVLKKIFCFKFNKIEAIFCKTKIVINESIKLKKSKIDKSIVNDILLNNSPYQPPIELHRPT